MEYPAAEAVHAFDMVHILVEHRQAEAGECAPRLHLECGVRGVSRALPGYLDLFPQAMRGLPMRRQAAIKNENMFAVLMEAIVLLTGAVDRRHV